MSARTHPHAAARRCALDILFQADVRGEHPMDALQEWLTDGREVPEFARELVEGVGSELEELDLIVGANAHEWTVPRMAAVDRSILRLATYELLHRPDVPAGAAIDEAVRAAQELSTEDSGRFVNGVLGAVARSLPLAEEEDAER
ncbi:MAG: transcription antitermination factor NusB [Actinomycetota bacterium]